jgi:tetratricopeptide (TPR) repeat protein
MVCLATALDLAGVPGEAAQVLKAHAKGYPSDAIRWYGWAKRLKRPDAAAAREATDAYIAAHPEDPSDIAWLHLIDGDLEGGINAMMEHDASIYYIPDQLNYAVVAAEAGKKAKTEAILKKVNAYTGDFQFKDLAQTLLALHNGAEVESTVLKYELALGPYFSAERNRESALLGRYLAAAGHKQQAVRLLTRAVRAPWTTHLYYTMSWMALERLGEDPQQLIDAARRETIDTRPVVGTWRAAEARTPEAEEWTFGEKGDLRTSTGLHGWYWVAGGRLLVSITPAHWAVLPWPLPMHAAHGDTQNGPNTLTLEKR